MKGYDACVFPREGEPVLITIEASEEDAARTAWTEDVRLIRGYDPEDPRPPLARTLDAAVEAATRLRAGRARALARHAGLGPHGRRAYDLHRRVVRRVRGGRRRDAAPRPGTRNQDRAGARAPAAGERARGGGDGPRPRAAPPGDEGGAGRRALAGLRARRGHGLPRQGRARAPVLARVGGPRDQDLHRHRRPARGRGRARPVRDLGLRRRLLGRPHEEPRGRRAEAGVRRAGDCAHGRLRQRARAHSARGADGRARPAGARAAARRRVRGPADASDLPRRRCARRTSRRIPTRPAAASSRRGWCSRSSRACTGPEAAGSASRTTSWSRATASRSSRSFPDGVVRCPT